MKKTIAMMVMSIAVFVANAVTTPMIVSSQVRANDPMVLDVVYRVTSDKPTVNVRALAFEDGERSLWKVVRPETFIDGTAVNLGDNIAANTDHMLSWKISADWATDLAKVKFEILTSEQGQLPLDLITIPYADIHHKELVFSTNVQSDEDIFNALLWYYADGDDALTLYNGYLKLGEVEIAYLNNILSRGFALRYLYSKMGYSLLNGCVKGYANESTRVVRNDLYAVRPDTIPGLMYIREKAFMVIDISDGPNAEAYPISYLDSMPVAGWGDEYKTTKLILRRIPAGTFVMEPDGISTISVIIGGVPVRDMRTITITKDYYIGVYEVTQKQWNLVMGTNPSLYKGDMRPVENIGWNDIRGDSNFYNWPSVTSVDPNSFVGRISAKTGLIFDLPTEAQWVKAYYADRTSAVDWCLYSRTDKNQNDGIGGYSQHTIVGSYLPNDYGLYDMLGNVWEWVLDWTGGNNQSGATDPVGPTSGWGRKIRDGYSNTGGAYPEGYGWGLTVKDGVRAPVRAGFRISTTQ